MFPDNNIDYQLLNNNEKDRLIYLQNQIIKNQDCEIQKLKAENAKLQFLLETESLRLIKMREYNLSLQEAIDNLLHYRSFLEDTIDEN